MNIKVYKVEPTAQLPNYQTRKAACFDLSAFIDKEDITVFNGKEKSQIKTDLDGQNQKYYVTLAPSERALIRTGLIFDIPEEYSIRLHPRSGVALKYGLILANCEGVIDEDYINETKLIILNTTDQMIKIYHGDRIAQGEVVKYEQAEIEETIYEPSQKSNRVGGFGSTGIV
jgi:dUTP pyrophosphatase